MTSPEIPTDPVAAAALAREALRSAAAAQGQVSAPAHEDLHAYGSLLSDSLSALAELARTLAGQVEHYGDRRILRDDAGADPQARLAEAGQHLEQIQATATVAATAAGVYRAAIGHIDVAVDPDAEPG